MGVATGVVMVQVLLAVLVDPSLNPDRAMELGLDDDEEEDEEEGEEKEMGDGETGVAYEADHGAYHIEMEGVDNEPIDDKDEGG
jgi:hypothetical protein